MSARERQRFAWAQRDGHCRGNQRAECCETCKRHLKPVATLALPSAEALLETDLATTALDIAASDPGIATPESAGPTLSITAV